MLQDAVTGQVRSQPPEWLPPVLQLWLKPALAKATAAAEAEATDVRVLTDVRTAAASCTASLRFAFGLSATIATPHVGTIDTQTTATPRGPYKV